MTPSATYRLQFNGDFTFAQAQALIPYLDGLGVSHIYASPITVARSGSSHGYDVVDPTRINPELGGEDGFRSLVEALREHGMGVLLDIVPNHMGIGAENAWWWAVLQNGPESNYAQAFDIDWSQHGGRLLLPFLGTPLEQALGDGALEVRVQGETQEPVVCAYGDTVYPIRPEDHEDARALVTLDVKTIGGAARLAALLARQYYRLAWWRTGHDELNWRRFFSVSELVGVRVEDERVFELTHDLYFELYKNGLIDGLRVDHVDGLTDPAQYCRRVRDRLDALRPARPGALADERGWLIVEKILGPGEPLPDWPIDGTSGYEFMDLASAVLHDPAAEASLSAHWAAVSGRSAAFAPEEERARRQMLAWEFGAQRESCIRAFAALATTSHATKDFTTGMIARAIDALLIAFPVYRTYGTGHVAPDSDVAVRKRVRERVTPLAAPGEMPVVEAILDWLAGFGPGEPADAVRQFQQLSAPIAAKSVEDTAFYRYGRLLSRNDVGFDASRFAVTAPEFHERVAAQARRFPHSMLTTATHDHKRGEDVRGRIAALSTRAEGWMAATEEWRTLSGAKAKAVDPGDLYMLFQMLVGAWPDQVDAQDTGRLRTCAERLWVWQEKALREAKLRSSWIAPDAEYESGVRGYLDWVLTSADGLPLRKAIAAFVKDIEPIAFGNTLKQVVLRCTLPGVPDIYQGAEFRDFSLVDPDNRRPVDFKTRRAALEAEVWEERDALKQRVIASLLTARKASPDLFHDGAYRPLEVEGADAALGYARVQGDRALLVLIVLKPSPEDADPQPSLILDERLSKRLGRETIAGTEFETLSGALCPMATPYGIHLAIA